MPTDHAALYRELLPLLLSPKPPSPRGDVMSFCPAHPDGQKHHQQGGRSLSLHPERGLHCFAGCTFAAILAAFGISPNGQHEPRPVRMTPGQPGPADPDRLYIYRDETGRPCAEHGRWDTPEGKRLAWRKPGVAGWPTPSGVVIAELPLFGAEIIASADPSLDVVLVEGEPAALACREAGLLAVTLGGGSGQHEWGDALNVLRGRHIILWPDNAPDGRALMARVEMALRPIAASVRYVRLPRAVAVKDDAVDFFAAGGTWAEIEAGILREPVAEALAEDEVGVRMPAASMGVVLLRFSAIEVQRREINCELAITTPGGDPPYEQRINLLSSSQREALRRDLDTLYGKDYQWARVLATAWPLVRDTLARMERDFDLATRGDGMAEGFLVGTLIPRGHATVLFGEGAAAKSYLALAIGLSVARGVPFLRHECHRACVLYLDYESTSETLHFRAGRVMRGFGLYGMAPGLIRYWPARGVPLCEQIPALQEAIAKNGIGLLIVDSVGAACGGEPEKAEVALRFFNALASLRVTSLLIAHITKAGDTKSPLGSVYWSNLARRTWYVERVQEEDADTIELGMFCRKVNDGALPRSFGISVSFDGHSGPVTFREADLRDTPELQARRGLRARICDVLRAGAQSATSIAEELEQDREAVKRTLNRHPRLFQRVSASQGGRGAETLWGLSTA